MIRTGLVLPTFGESPDDALAVAQEAWLAGVDGFFCYDHLWPMGQPERPALAPFPILAALADLLEPRDGEDGPFLGTLVARVGLAPNDVLARQFVALANLAPGRVIAGLGTGDRLSQAENLAYGIPYPPAGVRRADLVVLAAELVGLGLTVWVAGGPAARTEEAAQAGAALNVWDAEPNLVAERSRGPGAVEVTWAGPAPQGSEALAASVTQVANAGATWAVYGWPVDPVVLVEAARAT